MEEQAPQQKKPAVVGGRQKERRQAAPYWVAGVVLAGASLVLYFGLGAGLRAKVDEDPFAFGKKPSGGPNGPLARGMKDEITFQRQLQKSEDRKARNVEEMSRQFGRSSVVYLKPGSATDSSGRLHYDDVGKSAGRTVHGILRPRDSRRIPNALPLSDGEVESALRSPIQSASVAGDMPGAGTAKDLAPLKAAASSSGGSGAFLAADEPRDPKEGRVMTVVKRGGFEGEYRVTKAVNADSGKVGETMALARAELPKVGTAETVAAAAMAGGPTGNLQKFEGGEAVAQAVAAVETGDAKKSQIGKLTSAYAFGKIGSEKGVAHEPRAEMGGIVFDGKKPPEAAVSGMGESQVGDPGGGNLRLSTADKMEGELKACRDAERAAATKMQQISNLGRDIRRSEVQEGRDALWSCAKLRGQYEECKKSCSGPKKSACLQKCEKKRPPYEKAEDALPPVISGLAARIRNRGLETLCADFDKASAQKQAACGALRAEAIQYGNECSGLVDDALKNLKDCYEPGKGTRCRYECDAD